MHLTGHLSHGLSHTLHLLVLHVLGLSHMAHHLAHLLVHLML